MKTRIVTIKVPIIPLPSWWTVTRWTVWLMVVTVVKALLPGVDFITFLAVVSLLGIGGAILTHHE